MNNLESIIEQLFHQFVKMDEYKREVQSGRIIEYKYMKFDDSVFADKHPEHPLAAPNRFVRIKAADEIRGLARKYKNTFSFDILQKLHISLFDCCAAVRLSVIQSLIYSGDESSIKHLEMLLLQEDESELVKKFAEEACLTLKKRK
ncbi:MAG TPA: HEAT repeat domain-containing protein [Alphaproteobacteria bacterium]|nr:HEAT repeat domain-containing protein [Alphaproteobacteria bacterium]